MASGQVSDAAHTAAGFVVVIAVLIVIINIICCTANTIQQWQLKRQGRVWGSGELSIAACQKAQANENVFLGVPEGGHLYSAFCQMCPCSDVERHDVLLVILPVSTLPANQPKHSQKLALPHSSAPWSCPLKRFGILCFNKSAKRALLKTRKRRAVVKAYSNSDLVATGCADNPRTHRLQGRL